MNSYNITIVIAAGNLGSDDYMTISSPGIAEDAITVGAVDGNGNLAFFNSRGLTVGLRVKPDVVAPSVNILSSVPFKINPEGKAVALLKQAHPNWNPKIIKSALMITASSLGYNPYAQGSGLINVSRAVQPKLLSYLGLLISRELGPEKLPKRDHDKKC